MQLDRDEDRSDRPRVTRAELEAILVPDDPRPGDPDAPRPVRLAYQAWLDQIDDALVSGALLISEGLPRVARAFIAGDRGCLDDTAVIKTEVAEHVREVEAQGFLLLARESPVAGDLRRLVSILRLVTAVERSAALLRHVAETLDRVDPRTLPPDVLQQADELGRRAGEVFRLGVDAWRTRDGLAVHEADAADEAVDVLSVGLVAHADRIDGGAELLVLGLLARYWERIADHGVSFAQHATFAVTGERVEVGP